VLETLHRLLIFQPNPLSPEKCYRITVKNTEHGFAICSSETTLVRVCLCSVVPKSLSLLTSLSGEVFEKLITKQLVRKFSVPHRSYHVQNSPPLAVPTREWGGAGTNYGSPIFRKGAVPSVKWARSCCLRFCLSRLYHYLSLVKVSTFSPSQTHSATESQSFRFRAKFLARPPLLEGVGGAKMFFLRGTGPGPCHWFLFWTWWIQLSPSS